ncbi:sphingosine-1-phosphate phosphatase 2 isoform X1 [Pipistrellus kuhlii]|uniref:Sphingosine-1-phosphate phosphatase 2 n=1 Tax=Pipistrellus kuhlii TaxID=59472 RepID=A0A7J7XX64_PIPKU|nr:sphingosine-1-phosphate phosphatase 2 isoform X1 [Pipistrellus kuhlii]XP_045431599.1 sphingosine-1-phosphate phosphatase 2 isoform X1 [Pipistrellus kuhlii]KAF6353950.1 sphingosine-1-phosphate phosphatase 2 [Pipistrellus kuhlii]
MAELLRSLQDSQLVARFQRRCGLFPAPEDDPRDDGAGLAEGAARAPGADHRSTANGKDAGAPANGLLRAAAPQAYVEKYIVKNYFYYYLFRFSAALGQEVFYITFLPFTHWNIDSFLSRRLVIIWVLVMYIGQVAKDILKWPRPFSPPVVKLEKRVIAEYGMPSTHAMAATAISFTLLISTMDRYQYPFALGLAMAVTFSALVCLSRLYTGMHTVLDVLGGILITAVLIVLTYPAWTLIDRLGSASPLFPVCAIVVPFFLCYNYPVSEFYSPTRADTTTIVAAGAGVTTGFWINHFFQLVADPTEALPVIQHIPPLTAGMLVLGLTKFMVGIVLILLVRQVVQNLSLQVLYSWFKVVTRNKEARRRLEIEVPYKFVTYTSVGICATTVVPMLHRFLGLL